MPKKALAALSAALITGITALLLPAAASAVEQTSSCTDGGGHLWRAHATWGAVSAGKVALDRVGFTSAAPDATTVDFSMRSYNGAGTQVQVTGGQDVAFNFDGGKAYLERNLTDPPSAPGKTKVTVNVGDGNDGKANCTVTFVQPATDTPTPTPSPSVSSSASPTEAGTPSSTTTTTPSPTVPPSDPVTVAAVGDIACAPGYTVTSTTCQHKAVSDKILADNPARFLALGDLQYEAGALSGFQQSYDPTFGRLKAKTLPVPGNHEYGTANAAGYYSYFGALAGDPAKGYYSTDIGAWHVVALNSEKDTSATGAQVAWLKADLAAHPSACTLAFWHKPRWSTGGHGDLTTMAPAYQVLYDNNAELVLSGHDHDYERFVPLNPAGVRDDARGLVQIVSGLGGKSEYTVTGRATTAAKNNSGFGYTKLVLRDGAADISYVPAIGTFTDRTTVTCHGATQTSTPTPSSTPTAPAPDPTPAVTSPAPTGPVQATQPVSTEAARLLGWGEPSAWDEFAYTGAPNPALWGTYNSAGHNGKGLRRPSQWYVNGEYARVTGTKDGTTGGMGFRPDRGTVHGRWEARMRTTRQAPYHPVLIVWPDAQRNAATNYQEIDFIESTKTVGVARFYLHFANLTTTTSTSRTLDMTQWHNYAVEWTPSSVTGWIDGQKWFEDRTASHIPKAPSHLTAQLDWFPGDGPTTTSSTMDIDWVRAYRP